MIEPKAALVLAGISASSLMAGMGMLLSGEIPAGVELLSPAMTIGVLLYIQKQAERREERMSAQYMELLKTQQEQADAAAARTERAIVVQTELRDALLHFTRACPVANPVKIKEG